MLHELRVGSECQAADDRMQPVCPNDEIETTRTRMLESYVHTHFILGKSLDAISEHVICVVRTRLMQNSCEVATRNLHIFGHNRRSQRRDIDSRYPPAIRVQKSHSFKTDARRAQIGGNVHPLGHVDCGATHIYGTAA